MLKRVLLLALCLGLAACSSFMSSSKQAQAVVVDEESYAQGMGSEDALASEGNRMRAPYSQTYYFSFDDSSVDQADIPSVRVQARYLATHPKARVMLGGHTDERGSREYNIALGERRARRVADVLRLAGVRANQIRMVSYGQEKPAAFGHTEEAYRLNRRVNLTYEATA